jgi:RNA polymerase sigma-70 factor (ECF subfamily)
MLSEDTAVRAAPAPAAQNVGARVGRFYDEHARMVLGICRVLLRDLHEAEDAAQQVFTKLFEALPRYERSRGSFRAWLFVIVRNHAITEIAKRNRVELLEANELDRRRELNGPSEDSALSALDWISDKDLLIFIERLPLAQRQVLMLRYMLDLPHADVARVLGKTPDDVRHLQSRALAFIRKRLTALGREPARSRLRTLRCPKQAPVLRMRRFSLTSSA